jgi:hypothetical protein
LEVVCLFLSFHLTLVAWCWLFPEYSSSDPTVSWGVDVLAVFIFCKVYFIRTKQSLSSWWMERPLPFIVIYLGMISYD